jgi:hypothetical protein
LGALGRLPVAVVWLLLAAAAIRATRRFGRPRPEGWVEAGIWASVAAILAIAGFTALASPPNSVDAFGYHLSRVVWWAQQGSVSFFPTHYYPQVSMPPMAEYAMLHGWLLSGGDRLANLGQWVGFAGSVAAAALIAGQFGAARRGQALSALFAATLPNGILQASGAKNDCLLTLWLAAAGYFALRWAAEPGRRNAVWLGLALGLAVATKATAWLFAPPLVACLLLTTVSKHRRNLPEAAGVVLLCVVTLNGAQWRNIATFSSPLGPATAQADQDPHFRWTNERIGIRTTVSNAARHLSQQLGGRSEWWNRGVYDAVLQIHRLIGADPNDPATTWPHTAFAPPVNANHEADAPNRTHLLLLVVCLPFVLRRRLPLLWTVSLVAGWLLVSGTLKYQPFFSRAFLPLFVLAAPLAGLAAERLRPAILQAALCLLLIDGARHPLFDNWTRPLGGPASILNTPRAANYFRDMGQFGVGEAEYRRAAELASAGDCRTIGVDNDRFHLEYPLQLFLLERDPAVRFVHTGMRTAAGDPCAVVCLGCADVEAKTALYSGWGEPERVGRFLVYRRGAASAPPRKPQF